jgi:hypothetical protein
MVKSLKDILQGVKSSKKVKNDLGGYKPKAGDEEKFAVKHEIEKHEDRVGNGDDVYNATNVKHSIEGEERHGYKKPKDEKVNEEKKTCNMTEAGQMCEVHGMSDCSKGGKKVLKEKEPVSEEADYEYEMARNELATAERAIDRLMKHLKGEGSLEAWVQSKITKAADYLDSVADYMESDKVNEENIEEEWYSEKGGERTYHRGQREAMRHARQIGGSYGATHGAQGQKASKALGLDAREKAGLGLGLKSKADRQKEAQKQKAAKKAGPWGMREETEVNEVLSKDSSAGEWIKDFVDSDNPKFKGKSKEKRKQMALAAYYDKQRNEEVDESLAVPLLGSVSGAKKKVKKEQTGPDTPLTLPNMSVDVNTGRNV